MSSSIAREIVATRTDRQHESPRMCVADPNRHWTRGSIVTLPHGQLVLIVAEGIYQAVSTGELCLQGHPIGQ